MTADLKCGLLLVRCLISHISDHLHFATLIPSSILDLFVDLTPNTGLEHFGVVRFRPADFIVNYKNISPGELTLTLFLLAISFGDCFLHLNVP